MPASRREVKSQAHGLLLFAEAVRVRQWAKNLLLLAGFLFAGRLRAPWPEVASELTRVALGFGCFCALAGAAYLLNDVLDREQDRLHPTKFRRPVASKRLSPTVALWWAAGLLLLAVLLTLLVVLLKPAASLFAPSALAYLGLTLAYSWRLKHEVIVDVLTVAAGFVLRVVAGCLLIPVAISPWIVFCTFTLALFIALCKRRAELVETGEAAGTRKVLPHYTVPLLDTWIAVAAGLSITAYSLYTFNAPHTGALGGGLEDTPLLMTTIPFVVYGVFRYLLLAQTSAVGGEPEQMLRDRPLLWNMAAWALVVTLLTLAGKYR